MTERDIRDIENLFQELLDTRIRLLQEKQELEVEVARLSDLVDELSTNLEIAENRLIEIEEAGL